MAKGNRFGDIEKELKTDNWAFFKSFKSVKENGTQKKKKNSLRINLVKKYLDKLFQGMSFGVGFFIILLGLFLIAYAGWHPASQIISGVFKGNYTFAGNVKFNKQLQLPNVANVSCNSNTSGIIAYNYSSGNYLICQNGIWYYTNLIPILNYIISIYNPNTENLTNFQVEVNISKIISSIGTNFSIITNQGEKINYCFVQQNGECKANYDNVNKIWVKVPLLPAGSTVNLTIISSKANNALNGDKVFDFYDDFDENTLNTSKWQLGDNKYGPIYYSLENGLLKTWSDGSNYRTILTNKTIISPEDKVIVEARVKSESADHWHILALTDKNNNGDYDRFNILDSIYSGNTIGIELKEKGGSFEYPKALGTMNNNEWYKVEIVKKSPVAFEGIFMYDNNSIIGSYENDNLNYDTSHGWVIRQWKINDTYDYWDWVDVRKYAPLSVSVNVIQK